MTDPLIRHAEVKDFREQTSRNLASAKVPFVPYDLRHTYAIRGTVVHKTPLPVMARMIGYSPQQHLNTYSY